MGWLGKLFNKVIPQSKYYEEALHAIWDNDKSKIEELLRQNPALINAAYSMSGSLLHNAASRGNVEITEMLIAKGAGINAQSTRDNEAPIHVASGAGQLETVKVLVEHRADINTLSCGSSPLDLAVWGGLGKRNVNKDLVKYLVAKGAKHSAVHVASVLGDMQLVDKAIADGTDINTKDNKGYTPLYWAIVGDDLSATMTNFLLARGADVNGVESSECSAPLHIACITGNKAVVETLIAHGANVNKRGYFGSTPLLAAESHGYSDIVKLLLEHGANASSADAFGKSSLHEALFEDDIELISNLLSNGADPNALSQLVPVRGPGGKRMWSYSPRNALAPLHLAASNGYIRSAQLLIEHGAEVNIQDRTGRTPLHVAVIENKPDIVRMLLSNGADKNLKDKKGKTPINLTSKAGNQEIITLLNS